MCKLSPFNSLNKGENKKNGNISKLIPFSGLRKGDNY